MEPAVDMTACNPAWAEAAIDLIELGWPVFPIKPRTKVPYTRHGVNDATTDERVLLGLGDRWPDAGVAVACGAPGPTVLDVDDPDAGRDVLDRLAGNPAIPQVRTRRGWHFYFQGESRGTVKLPYGELRGRGSYVVSPPSIHPSGDRYEWEVRPQRDLIEVPGFLTAHIATAGTAGTGKQKLNGRVAHGGRHDHLKDFAVRLVRGGVTDQPTLIAHLESEFRANCEPLPPPSPGYFDQFASWAANSRIAGRERSRTSFGNVEDLATDQGGTRLRAVNGDEVPSQSTAVTFDAKGKLKLPTTPAVDDVAGLCAFLTTAFNLDPAHPIIAGELEGLRGPAGHAVLTRRGAPPIRFEPISRLNSPNQLDEHLSWFLVPSDGAVYGFKTEHCKQIAHVVRMLCGTSRAMSDEEETAGIVAVFLQGAAPLAGFTTYGTGGQRYEAAKALQRELDGGGHPIGTPRFLVDENTGEIVIRVQDLTDATRKQIGSSLARGWLDARLQNLGWVRVRLDGHALAGRGGRSGPHARVDVYRGLLIDSGVDHAE